MFRRIQSLILIVALITACLPFFMPIASISVDTVGIYDIYAAKITERMPEAGFIAWNYPNMILTGFSAALIFVGLLLYKKRSLQMRLCIVNTVLQIGAFVLNWMTVVGLNKNAGGEWHTFVAFGFPLVTAILVFTSIRFIIRDIALMHLYDRIR
ncbi:MAG: DUF4293 domain-containing protein [Culturomica sp.]|jgi:uncharacterized membrane protein YhdT|nr:DUF4293 domain-containing protein [Culturomica sp.]